MSDPSPTSTDPPPPTTPVVGDTVLYLAADYTDARSTFEGVITALSDDGALADIELTGELAGVMVYGTRWHPKMSGDRRCHTFWLKPASFGTVAPVIDADTMQQISDYYQYAFAG